MIDSHKTPQKSRPAWPNVNRRGEPIATSISNLKALLAHLGVRIHWYPDYGHKVVIAGPDNLVGLLHNRGARWIWVQAHDHGLFIKRVDLEWMLQYLPCTWGRPS